MDCEHGIHFSGLVVGIGALVVGFKVSILLFSGFYSESNLTFPKPSVANNVSRNFNSNLWSRIIPKDTGLNLNSIDWLPFFFSVRSNFLPTSHSRFVH